MKQKHFILVGIAVVLAFCPAILPSLLPAAIIGALLGIVAVYWALRSVDAEDQRLKAEVKRVEDEISKAREERDAALAHSEELDKFFKDNGYAELAENRQRIEIESADFDKQVEAKRNFRKYISITGGSLPADHIVNQYLSDKVNIRPVEKTE